MTDALRRDRRPGKGRRRGSVRTSGRHFSRRKAAAVLAGGLVLGVGAVNTLAAWTDNEQAQATFATGVFALESRVAAGSFADHTASPAQLQFNAASVSPGSLHYAFIDVKTTGTSTLAGMASFKPGTVSDDAAGLADFLKLRAVVIGSTTTCNAAALDGTTLVAVNAVPAALGDRPLSAAGGNTLRYCLEVSMVANAPSTLQGKNAKVTWTVAGTSDS